MEGEEKGLAKGREEGRMEGRKEGRMEGRMEGVLDTARKLLMMGISASQVMKATGLSQDQIDTLKN